LRFYGLDLYADLGTPRLSYRRLRLLLERMPWDSDYMRAREGERAEWGAVEHLLATVIDLLQVSNYQFSVANSKKSAKPSKPDPFPRPGARSRSPKRHRTELSQTEIERRLVAQLRRNKSRG